MADETEREVGADVTEEEDVYLADFDRGYKARAKDEPFDGAQNDAWQEGWQEADVDGEMPEPQVDH